MQLEDDRYWTMSYVESTRSVELEWKPESAAMGPDDFKRALRQLVTHLEEHHAVGTLVDVRRFGFRMNDGLDDWRQAHIVPAYSKAGLTRFAYVLPAGSQTRPGGGGASSSFETAYFDDPQQARAWLTDE